MADLSNAESIGGISVDITGNLSPLRAAMQEVKSLSQSNTITLKLNIGDYEQQLGKISSGMARLVEHAKSAGTQMQAAFKSASMAMVSPSSPSGAANPWTSAVGAGAYGNIAAVNPWTTAAIVKAAAFRASSMSAIPGANTAFAASPIDLAMDRSMRRDVMLVAHQKQQLQAMKELESSGRPESKSAQAAAAARVMASNKEISERTPGIFQNLGNAVGSRLGGIWKGKESEDRVGDAEKSGKAEAGAYKKGVDKAHGVGGIEGAISERNVFSLRGLETLSKKLGLPAGATGAFLAFEALRLTHDVASAAVESGHPERTLRGFDSVGSSMDVFSNKNIIEQAKSITSKKAQEKVLSAIEGIPILGQLIGVGTAIGDVHGGIQDSLEASQRSIGVEKWMHENDVGQSVRTAQVSGDNIEVHQAQERERKASLDNEIKNRTRETEDKIEHKKTHEDSWYSLSLMNRDRSEVLMDNPELDKQLQQIEGLKAQRGGEDKLNEAELKQLKSVRSISAIGTMSQAESAGARNMIDMTLASRATGSDEAARKLKQSDESRAMVDAGRMIKPKENNPQFDEEMKKHEEDAAALAAKHRKDDVDTAEEIQARITKNKSDTGTTRLQTDRQYYAAKLKAARDAADAENITLKKAKGPEQDAAKDRQAAIIDNIKVENSRMVSESIQTSIGSIGSSIMTAQGMGFQGQMFARRIQQGIELRGIENPMQRAFSAAGFGMENIASQKQHDFDLKSYDIGQQASIASSAYRMHNEKMSASVAEQSAAAVLAVRNAPKERIEEARKTQLDNLEAMRHEMLDPHGGGYAAIGTVFNMPGDPLGLTNAAKDRRDVETEIGKSKQAIMDEKGQEGWSPDEVKKMLGLMGDFLSAADGNFIHN